MPKLFALVVGVVTLAVAGQALALNPQPLPPRWISPPTHGGHEPVRHVPVVRF